MFEEECKDLVNKIRNSPHFRLEVNKNGNEVCLIFRDSNQTEHFMNCTSVSYPDNPPLWYADTEQELITNLVSNCTNLFNTLTSQVKFLIGSICSFYSLETPSKLYYTMPNDEVLQEAMDTAEEEDNREPSEVVEILKNLKEKNVGNGTVLGTTRLLSEINILFEEEKYKEKKISVKFVEDNIYEWEIKLDISLFKSDSLLYEDLLLDESHSILIHIVFDKQHPHNAPFYRIIRPILECNLISGGGAVCLKSLTRVGWRPTILAHHVISEIIDVLEETSRIQFGVALTRYSLRKAKQSFSACISENFGTDMNVIEEY